MGRAQAEQEEVDRAGKETPGGGGGSRISSGGRDDDGGGGSSPYDASNAPSAGGGLRSTYVGRTYTSRYEPE
jgi:hypothetical protein